MGPAPHDSLPVSVLPDATPGLCLSTILPLPNLRSGEMGVVRPWAPRCGGELAVQSPPELLQTCGSPPSTRSLRPPWPCQEAPNARDSVGNQVWGLGHSLALWGVMWGLEKGSMERCSLGGSALQNRSQLPEVRARMYVSMSGGACRMNVSALCAWVHMCVGV